jgi:predicted nucleotidyltransferase
MQLVDIPILRCHRCAYAWRPSQPVVRICPRCKSKNWDEPKIAKNLGKRTGLGVAEVIGSRRKDLVQLARRHGARDVRVFGSVRRGQATADSDLDLLVRFSKGIDLFDQMHLEEELSKLLGRKVDVVTEAGLHPLVRPQVLYEAEPV